jgi:hypothetical protein
MRRRFLKSILIAGAWARFPQRVSAHPRFKPIDREISALVTMKHSAFPYDGDNPETNEPFLNVLDGHRRGHKSPRGGINWEDTAYSDRRSLFYLPTGFNLRQPAYLVVFLHGNNATLERDVVGRQHIPRQLAQSRINAVLAAPQFASDLRDSSPGNFWRAGYFSKWLAEAGITLAKLHGQGATAADFARLPVILVAYSGGYFPAAWCLKLGGASRIKGVVLMDALYGDTDKFLTWIATHHKVAFFFSAYSKASRAWNLQLQSSLTERGIGFSQELPNKLRSGAIVFAEVAGESDHDEFMSQAWTIDPLNWVLGRIKPVANL